MHDGLFLIFPAGTGYSLPSGDDGGQGPAPLYQPLGMGAKVRELVL